jgi:hypothetical protein
MCWVWRIFASLGYDVEGLLRGDGCILEEPIPEPRRWPGKYES